MPFPSDIRPHQAELNKAINRLKNKKTSGKDGVFNISIKHIRDSCQTKIAWTLQPSKGKLASPPNNLEAIIVLTLKKDKDAKKKTSPSASCLLSCHSKTPEYILKRPWSYLSTTKSYPRKRHGIMTALFGCLQAEVHEFDWWRSTTKRKLSAYFLNDQRGIFQNMG